MPKGKPKGTGKPKRKKGGNPGPEGEVAPPKKAPLPPKADDAVEQALAVAQEAVQAAPYPEGGPYFPRTREGVGGRPTTFTAELAAEICSRLADGQSLREVCADEGMPARLTVMRWVFTNPEFYAQYRAAREMQSEVMIDEIKDIADDSANDYMERRNSKGEFIGWMENGDSVRRAALRINTRQWIGARMQPRKWGDKKEVTHQNPDGTPVGQPIDPRNLSPEAREALAQALRAAMAEGAIETTYEEQKP